jgi:hypothetical protein
MHQINSAWYKKAEKKGLKHYLSVYVFIFSNFSSRNFYHTIRFISIFLLPSESIRTKQGTGRMWGERKQGEIRDVARPRKDISIKEQIAKQEEAVEKAKEKYDSEEQNWRIYMPRKTRQRKRTDKNHWK